MIALRPRRRAVAAIALAAGLFVCAPAFQARAADSKAPDKSVESKSADEKPDAALDAQLDRRLPEINFNGNSLSDVIDFLRDVTGINMSVNWNILEAAGVKKDTPVTLRLKDVKFRTALKVMLDELSNSKVKLGWTVTDNVLVISTVEEAKKP